MLFLVSPTCIGSSSMRDFTGKLLETSIFSSLSLLALPAIRVSVPAYLVVNERAPSTPTANVQQVSGMDGALCQKSKYANKARSEQKVSKRVIGHVF